MKQSDTLLRGHLIALFTCLIWGTTFISTKILLRDFTPIEILFSRFILGFLALSLAYPHRLSLKSPQHKWYFIGAGLSGVTLYFLFENIALSFTDASNVSVIVAVCPFFTALLSRWFLCGESLNPQFFIGFLCSMVGIALISFHGGHLSLHLTGDILAILAAIVWSIYSILTRKLSEFGYKTIPTTRCIFGYGLLLMIPALFLLDFSPVWTDYLKPINLLNLLYLGLGASAACFATWHVAQHILGAIRTSVYIYCVPVIGVLFSVLILHEQITLPIIIGTCLTLCGLILSEHRIPLCKTQNIFKNDV